MLSNAAAVWRAQALNFAEREFAERLGLALGVTGVPSVVVLRCADSAIVSASARAEVIDGPPSLKKWIATAARADLPPLPRQESMVLGSCAAAA